MSAPLCRVPNGGFMTTVSARSRVCAPSAATSHRSRSTWPRRAVMGFAGSMCCRYPNLASKAEQWPRSHVRRPYTYFEHLAMPRHVAVPHKQTNVSTGRAAQMRLCTELIAAELGVRHLTGRSSPIAAKLHPATRSASPSTSIPSTCGQSRAAAPMASMPYRRG